MVAPKSILITPERPRTPGKRNVLFEKEVVIINVGARVPLAEPAATNDELAFDFNPPDSTGDAHYSKGGPRSGTMRIKGGMANMYAKAAAAEEERRKQEEESKAKQEPVLLSGYMKVLKESGMKSSWQKRFITLTSHALAYHRSADAFKAMKSFELNGDCFVREISQRTGVIDCKNALEVVFSRNKSLVLKGVSQRESTEWITAICAAIDVFAPSEDEDEFDFVDEDDDEFVDEDDAPSRDPAPFSDTPAMVMSSTTTVVAEVKPDGSAHVEAMMETSVSEEVSDSFEWVDEDEARARDTASSTEQSQAEKAKQQEEEEAQKKRDADAQKRKADADAKAKAEADAKAKAKAEADAKGKAKSEAEARAKAKAEADARAKTAAEAKAKAEAEAKAQAEARAKAEAAERERVAQETRKKQEAEELARKEAEKAKQAEEANARSSKIQSRVPTPGPAHHPNFQAHRANRPSGLSGASIKGTKPRGGRVGNLLAMFEPPK